MEFPEVDSSHAREAPQTEGGVSHDGNDISLQQLALSLPNMNECFSLMDGLMLPQISGSSEQKQRHSISKHSTASPPPKLLHFGEPIEVSATASM
eukprot:c53669_g1_i1 orf=519-803(+)